MKLTSKMLRKIIEEEASRFGKEKDVYDVAKDTEEVDADKYADSLEKKIDYEKALKIEETRLRARLKKVRENRIKLRKSLLEDL